MSGYPWEEKEKTGLLVFDPLDGFYCGLSLAVGRLGVLGTKFPCLQPSPCRVPSKETEAESHEC